MNLTQKQKLEAIQKRLNVVNFPFDNEEENRALISLSEKQLETLERDIKNDFPVKYDGRCVVDDILGAGFAWAKASGELTTDSFFKCFHELLNGAYEWTAVFVSDVDLLASVIVEEAANSIEEAVRGTDANKWWDFITYFDKQACVDYLAREMKEGLGAIETEYRGVKIVIFETPFCDNCLNGALYM